MRSRREKRGKRIKGRQNEKQEGKRGKRIKGRHVKNVHLEGN